MKHIGIVGNSGDKITSIGETRAKEYILNLLIRLQDKHGEIVVVSGDCPFGGIDGYAEAIADQMNIPTKTFSPQAYSWDAPGGFRARNIKIVDLCDEVHIITVNQLPHDKKENNFCYHCNKKGHVPSGGCWTGHRAKKSGKPTEWHIIDNRLEEDIPHYPPSSLEEFGDIPQ